MLYSPVIICCIHLHRRLIICCIHLCRRLILCCIHLCRRLTCCPMSPVIGPKWVELSFFKSLVRLSLSSVVHRICFEYLSDSNSKNRWKLSPLESATVFVFMVLRHFFLFINVFFFSSNSLIFGFVSCYFFIKSLDIFFIHFLPKLRVCACYLSLSISQVRVFRCKRKSAISIL